MRSQIVSEVFSGIFRNFKIEASQSTMTLNLQLKSYKVTKFITVGNFSSWLDWRKEILMKLGNPKLIV